MIPADKNETVCSSHQASLNRELLDPVLAGSCSTMAVAECNFEEVGRQIAHSGMSERGVEAFVTAWH